MMSRATMRRMRVGTERGTGVKYDLDTGDVISVPEGYVPKFMTRREEAEDMVRHGEVIIVPTKGEAICTDDPKVLAEFLSGKRKYGLIVGAD